RDAAVRCGSKFTSERIMSKTPLEFNEKENAYRMMLLAGNRSEAQTLTDRWLASIPADDDTMRVAVLSRLVVHTLNVPSIWFAEAFRLAETIPMKTFWATRISLTYRILIQGERIRDTAQSYAAARWLVTTPALVGDSIVRSS